MVELLRHPDDRDWYEVKRRALVTVGKKQFSPPTDDWKHKMLEARHVHAQPYIKSQRNDRQSEYDRNAARQDATVQMIFDVNAEELMAIANKRLCSKAAKETRELVAEMCALVEEKCPEFRGMLVPMCEYHGGVCHEIDGCGKAGRHI